MREQEGLEMRSRVFLSRDPQKPAIIIVSINKHEITSVRVYWEQLCNRLNGHLARNVDVVI